MNQIPLINAIRKWEQELEIENEHRQAYRLEPYRERPSDFPPYQPTRRSPLAWLARLGQSRRPAQPCYAPECCADAQPG